MVYWSRCSGWIFWINLIKWPHGKTRKTTAMIRKTGLGYMDGKRWCEHLRNTLEIQWNTPVTTTTGWWFGTFFIFLYIGNNHPNWLIFFRGVATTNQMMFPSKHHLLYLGGSVATFDYWRVNMMLPQFYCSISPCLLVSSTVPIALDPLTLHLICFMFISQVLFNINHIPSCKQTWLLQIRNQWCFDGKIIYKL